jgi:hypothetical protein
MDRCVDHNAERNYPNVYCLQNSGIQCRWVSWILPAIMSQLCTRDKKTGKQVKARLGKTPAFGSIIFPTANVHEATATLAGAGVGQCGMSRAFTYMILTE